VLAERAAPAHNGEANAATSRILEDCGQLIDGPGSVNRRDGFVEPTHGSELDAFQRHGRMLAGLAALTGW